MITSFDSGPPDSLGFVKEFLFDMKLLAEGRRSGLLKQRLAKNYLLWAVVVDFLNSMLKLFFFVNDS